MEPFVRYIVAGGLAMMAGLWIVTALQSDTTPWLLGPLLVLVGGGFLLYGIAEPLEY